ICFVAHKYNGDIKSKGFDYFIEIGKFLGREISHLRFHVVGEYEPYDHPLGEITDRTTFYGRQPSDFFRQFYSRMDGIVSVNRPFVLTPGAFDGFPTGACLEAGFHGVANFINDPLGLNPGLKDGTDILLIDEDLNKSAARILAVLRDRDQLMKLGLGAYRAFSRIVDVDQQLAIRTDLIGSELLKLKDAQA
ncbi:MAG: LPS biosynthesis protein RfbU, partial [Alphaproteobacteria bacterium]|nr:LPS biosynthesis protein RfbU [Alphaproteobacteria bacterium]